MVTSRRLEGGAESFRYLAQSETFMLEDNDDAANLRSTLDAMAIIGLTEQEREDVLTVVAAVLHLGNVTFMGNDRDEARPNGPVALEALAILSHLLKVRPSQAQLLPMQFAINARTTNGPVVLEALALPSHLFKARPIQATSVPMQPMHYCKSL